MKSIPISVADSLTVTPDPTPRPAAEATSADWQDRLRDITARIRRAAWSPPPPNPEWLDEARGFHLNLLDCATALEQLHATLNLEFGRCHQLETQVVEAQAALSRAVSELVGTRAGEQRAHYRAQHDSLTALPNPGYFRERLDHTLGHAGMLDESPAVIFLDLDGFKAINDRHGHDAGDEMLRIVARRLSHAMRARDMVGRLGGDEFACLLADMPTRAQLSQLACKLLETVSAPMRIGQALISVRPSVGIAMHPTDGTTGAALLKSADTAMYRAKRHRTGYAFFGARTELPPHAGI